MPTKSKRPDAFELLEWCDELHTIEDYPGGIDDDVVLAVQKARRLIMSISVILRETPIKPRQPLNEFVAEIAKGNPGYLESDQDFVSNNMEAAVRLLELFGGES